MTQNKNDPRNPKLPQGRVVEKNVFSTSGFPYLTLCI